MSVSIMWKARGTMVLEKGFLSLKTRGTMVLETGFLSLKTRGTMVLETGFLSLKNPWYNGVRKRFFILKKHVVQWC
jgi:hypothetical protein